MTLCRDYVFVLDGRVVEGPVFAYHGYNATDPEEYIELLRNCDKSRISGVFMIPPDATGSKDKREWCKVYICVMKGIVDITIESWHTGETLFHYEGGIDD